MEVNFAINDCNLFPVSCVLPVNSACFFAIIVVIVTRAAITSCHYVLEHIHKGHFVNN